MRNTLASCRVAMACIALTATGSIAISAGAAPSGPKSGQFDQIASVTSPRLTMKSTEHITFKGTRFRMERVDVDTDQPYEEINDGQSYYQYIPANHTALRVMLKDKQPGPLDQLRAQTEQMLNGAQKSGSGSINGFDCDIYTRDLGNGSKVTLYQSKDARFPYVVKTILSNPSDSTTRTNMIDNVKLDVPVGDDVFTLPKGTKIVEQPGGQAPGGVPGPDTGQNPPAIVK